MTNTITQTEQELFYVHAYHTRRLYGGPEEGGWYYDSGEMIAVFPVQIEVERTYQEEDGHFDIPVSARLNTDQVKAAHNVMRELLSDKEDKTYHITVQPRIITSFPEIRPRYE